MNKFLIQTDDVMRTEKSAVRRLMCTTNASEIPTVIYRPLSRLSELDGHLAADYVPIGSVEFCRARMQQLSLVEPTHMSYPLPLRDYLGRELTTQRYADVATGNFVKPAEAVKLFTGHLKGLATPEDAGVLQDAQDVLVWSCAPVLFMSEVRYYILNGAIIGSGRYDDGLDDVALPDAGIVQTAVATMNRALPPAGYALDFGVTNDGKTALVEANDGWALGLYRSPSMIAENYLRLVTARWHEIVSQ